MSQWKSIWNVFRGFHLRFMTSCQAITPTLSSQFNVGSHIYAENFYFNYWAAPKSCHSRFSMPENKGENRLARTPCQTHSCSHSLWTHFKAGCNQSGPWCVWNHWPAVKGISTESENQPPPNREKYGATKTLLRPSIKLFDAQSTSSPPWKKTSTSCMEGIDLKEAKHTLVPMIISDYHNVHTMWSLQMD